MIPVRLILALWAAIALAPRPACAAQTEPPPDFAAPVLDARLLAGHPGLFSGDVDGVRADWLAALGASPDADSASLAAQLLRELEASEGWTRPLRPHELTPALSVARGDAAHFLRLLQQDALDRARLGAAAVTPPVAMGLECPTIWRVIGELGDGARRDPLRLDEPWLPQHALAEEQRHPVTGRMQAWRLLPRQPNQLSLNPARGVLARSGTVYALAFLRFAAGSAVLEVSGGTDMRIWWDGALALDLADLDLATRSVTRHRALLTHPADGNWHALLIRLEARQWAGFELRLLDARGEPVSFNEWTPSSWPTGAIAAAGSGSAQPLPQEPLPAGNGWERVLACVAARLAGRVDEALALDPPTEADPEVQRAWLFARWQALRATRYYPSDVLRARLLDLEHALEEAGALPPVVAEAIGRRLLREDRPLEALAVLEAALERAPAFLPLHSARWSALDVLDERGALTRSAVVAAREALPEHPAVLMRAARANSRSGLRGEALALGRAAVALGATPADALQLFSWLAQGDDADRREAERMAELWLAAWPADESWQGWLDEVWQRSDQVERSLASLRARAQRSPWLPEPWRALGDALVAQDRVPEGLEAYRKALELQPSSDELRRLCARLGAAPDQAEDFFSAFGPDPAAVWTDDAAASDADAATALLLDHGMIYVLPDGGLHYRTHVVQRARNRDGTESMHERSMGEMPRRARVVQADGAAFEPNAVDDNWVFPELDPGDAVSVEQDHTRPGDGASPPEVGTWRFASFEEPYQLSRLVAFLPDGVAGEFRTFQYDGSHSVAPWGGGTVHVFESRNQPRRRPEVMQPSADEILPWLAFGEDLPLADRARELDANVRHDARPPAEIRRELDAFLAAASLPEEPLARAAALYAAVERHLQEYTHSGDVVDAWTLRRGDPLVLLAALLERAGVPFHWAFVASAAPGLLAEPLRPFVNGDEFEESALRLEGGPDGVTWILATARGEPFGAVRPAQMGAQALVLLGEGRHRVETISTASLAEAWDVQAELDFRVGAEQAADLSGILRVGGAQGGQLRQAVRDLEPAERDQAARAIVGQLVPGLDLATHDFPGLETDGGEFALEFSGAVPGYLRAAGNDFGARLHLPELELAANLGAAERILPFAFRDSIRVRARVRLEVPEGRRIEYGPQDRAFAREGFSYAFQVEREDRQLAVTRTLEMRGCTVPAAEFPDFLAFLRDVEQQEKRAVRVLAHP